MSADIQTTIDKWFQETLSEIKKTTTEVGPADIVCQRVLAFAPAYSKSVLLLLEQNQKFPAMSVLRVLGELTLRLLWCLCSGSKKETPDIKAERWLKHELLEHKKVLEKVLPAIEAVQLAEKAVEMQHIIEWLEKKANQIQPKGAGSLYGSLDTIPVEAKNEIYPVLYASYLPATHPCLWVLRDLAIKDEAKENVILRDPAMTPKRVLTVGLATTAYLLSVFIRIRYKLDYARIRSEYFRISQQKS